MNQVLHIGGLIAVGFTSDIKYLVAVSHSGTGLYQVDGWVKIARSLDLNYPDNGFVVGIGPIDGSKVKVQEMDYQTEKLSGQSPNGEYRFNYDDGLLTIQKCA